MNSNKISRLLIIIIILLVAGCAGYQKIRQADTYSKIQPVAPLPQYVNEKQPFNLFIKIDNVADLSGSYKNRLDVYINKFLIEPADEITNVKRNYLYKVRLQPGFYEINARYYASTGWEEKSFKITTKENVMIFPNKQATLKLSLKKNSWGGLKEKTSYFDVSYDKISQQEK